MELIDQDRIIQLRCRESEKDYRQRAVVIGKGVADKPTTGEEAECCRFLTGGSKRELRRLPHAEQTVELSVRDG